MKNVQHRTFVLVHGAWHGAWVWRDVMPGLRALGHTVTAPTLTGLASVVTLVTTPLILGPMSRTLFRLSKWKICATSHWLAGVVAAW
jgi:hypothetical protein